jgi:hypothetical protein
MTIMQEVAEDRGRDNSFGQRNTTNSRSSQQDPAEAASGRSSKALEIKFIHYKTWQMKRRKLLVLKNSSIMLLPNQPPEGEKDS